jgi:hypothetical protein
VVNIPSKIRLAVLLLILHGPAVGSPTDSPRKAVDAFGAALIAGDADQLRAVFPSRGKVRVHLVYLGPEQGALRGSQLHAVLQDFLERGNVTAFEIRTVERSEHQALASADVALIDPDGKRAKVRLHLSLEPEDDRWVLREMRESSP